MFSQTDIAVSDLTEFFYISEIENIHNIIDQQAILATYWNDDNDLDLKRRKEAEFLLEDDLPVSALLGFAVFNDIAKQKLIECGIQKDRIVIKPKYYF